MNWDKVEKLIIEIADEAKIDLNEVGSITIHKDGPTQSIHIAAKVFFTHEKYGELSDMYIVESN
jgi:hypothetical protein